VTPAVHRDRLENWSRALIWLWGLDYCPLAGHKPGSLLACLLDITPWGDIYISWGEAMTPCVGNVVWGENLSPYFVWVWGFSLTQTCLSGLLLFGPREHKGTRHGTMLKEQGSYSLAQNMGHNGLSLTPRCIESGRIRTPTLFYSILFYSIQLLFIRYRKFYGLKCGLDALQLTERTSYQLCT
jgi:hypothetical protein